MENHFEFPYGFNNGFHDEFCRVSLAYLLYEESHGVLQVFLAHNVCADVFSTDCVRKRTGAGFTISFPVKLLLRLPKAPPLASSQLHCENLSSYFAL